MTVLDYILDGIEAELALERELGVRFVDCDREVLKVETAQAVSEAPSPTPQPSSSCDLVFLHHKELSGAGMEMMTKIIAALGLKAESAPILTDLPIPKAKVYVILGGLALQKFQPNLKGVPGQWLKSEKGAEILVTYSPEYILRFKEVTPAIRKIKTDMWLSLKSILQRI